MLRLLGPPLAHTASSLVVTVVALAAWLSQSPGPSPFFWADKSHFDPLEDVFQNVLSRLRKEHPNTTLWGSPSQFGADGSGQWTSRQGRLIQCSPEVAEEMMDDLKTWFPFAAERAGATLQLDRHDSAAGCGPFSRFATNVKAETASSVLRLRRRRQGPRNLPPTKVSL